MEDVIELNWCVCVECFAYMPCHTANPVFGHHNGWEYPPYTEHSCPHCENQEPLLFELTEADAKARADQLKGAKYGAVTCT